MASNRAKHTENGTHAAQAVPSEHTEREGHAVDLTFGEAMEKLEEIVSQLEENEALGLEQSLALYEQGLALAGDCQQRLAAAKLRMSEISATARGDEG